MKTKLQIIFFAITMIFVMGQAMAQSPDAFNYQAVARDAAGDILSNQPLGIRVSLHNGSSSGTVDYSETFTPTTNEFGLFTLSIGTGIPVSGLFDTLHWEAAKYWLQVEMDPAGGTSYTDMGTSQLLSVPYAMYAENSVWTRAGSNTYYNSGNVGIGTDAPAVKLHVMGALRLDNTNPLMQFKEDATFKGFIQSFLNDMIFANANDTGSVEFWTNYTEKMKIKANGYVGVDCTNPAYKFQVNGPTGSFNVSGIRIENSTASTGWSFYPSSSGSMIIGKSSNLGTFDGTTGAYTSSSDARLKTNVRSLETVLPSIMGLELKRYEFINNNPTHKESIGIIAQDLQKVFPEFVSVNTTNEGNPAVENQMGVDYSGLSVIAIKAIQEQQEEIELLKQQIELLKQQVELLSK